MLHFFESSLLAHVTYVADPEKVKLLEWKQDWDFLLEPVKDPLYLSLILITLIVVVALFAACELVAPLRKAFQRAHDMLISYHRHIPLILRTALGVSLVVAGTKRVLLLPSISGVEVSTLEVVLGFCLTIGFMGRLSAIATFCLYFYGLYTSYYMWGAMETAASALLVVAYGSASPSADEILGTDNLLSFFEPLWKQIRENTGLILRLTLGGTLIWLAITEKALSPRLCETVIIDYKLGDIIPVSNAMWVFSVGVIEFAVGLVLVLGFFTRSFALIAFLVLTFSFFYFKEEVAGHITFFAALIVLMITGAGQRSFDSLIAQKRRQVTGTATPFNIEPATAS